MNPLPNFLIIGAAKAGTTSLYQYLNQHPEVFLSVPKEPRFFALEGHPLDYRGPIQIINQKSVTRWEDYQALFAQAQGKKAIGEASTLYLYEPKAAERIQHYLGSPKIIVILRNPVSRAYSSYLHLVRDGQETLSFEAALEVEAERIRDNWPPLWHYQQRGYYFQQLQPYFDRFGPSQIRVFLFEDLVNNPTQLMKELFEFLEIDAQFVPDVSQQANSSGVPKIQWLSKLLNRKNAVKQLAKLALPRGLRKNIYATLQRSNTGGKTRISSQTKQQLIDLYREDVLQLQSLLGQDLSGWLKF
ncbi:MAG: sulfotransferase [Cyanobacteria bacterium P01_F01_bin.42]